MEKPKPALDPAARQKIISDAVEELLLTATAAERHRAVAAARAEADAVGDCGAAELVKAVRQAVQVEADSVNLRLRRDAWRERAPELLPWGAEAEDKREAVMLALECLQQLPADMSGCRVEEKIGQALKPLREEIEADLRIDQLITQGRGHVGSVLLDLYHHDVIDREEWNDYDLQKELEEAVAEAFKEQGGDYELTGSENYDEVAGMVEEIVADELDL